jgi:hypothetical protein
MRNFIEPSKILPFVLLIVLFSGYQPALAQAKQTSLDSRIFETFEQIDDRTNAHEQDVVVMRAQLDQLALEMGSLREQLARLNSQGDQEGVHAQKRRVHAEMVSKSAEYLNQAYKLVNAASDVISANLSDLASLANDVRKSGNGSDGAVKLGERIQENIAAGKSMRNALVQIRDWSVQDPALARKFESLRRLSLTLDKRIGVDRARVLGQDGDKTGAVRSKRLQALDETVDHLSDMYAEVMAEKEALKDLRDEVALSIQLGRLEMTQEVAARAIPNVSSPSVASTGVETLKDMASAISELNSSIIEGAQTPVSGNSVDAGEPGLLKIDAFQNF